MKKYVAIIVMLIVFSSSLVLAVLIDTNARVPLDTSLLYSDLQEELYDRDGRPLRDSKTREQLYKYHYAINEILKASSIGLIEGYKDGTFRPNASITKGEFIKLAVILSVNRNFDFSAIPTNLKHWSAPYVGVLEMQNVVNVGEYNDNNLNEPITRIEMICILSKIQINMKGISQYREAELPNYTDIDDLTQEEKGLLLHAARYELIPDMFETETIRPHDNLSRGDAAIAIMRIY